MNRTVDNDYFINNNVDCKNFTKIGKYVGLNCLLYN